jgi:carbonic anhydrase
MKTALALSSLVSLAAAICSHGTHLFPRDSSAPVKVASFSFTGLTGPLNWHGLKPENEACALGHEQSPINIDSAKIKKVKGSTLTFSVDKYPHGAEFSNLGSTVEVEVNGTLVRNGKTYSLRQFHFHTPSEHRIDDEYYPMEVHFVFQAAGKPQHSCSSGPQLSPQAAD